MADKRTYELDQIDEDLILRTHCIEMDILGNSEAEHVQIGTLLSGKSYVIPILNWSMSSTRHHTIAVVPNVSFHIDAVTIIDDDGNEHVGSSIFDLKLAGEYGVEMLRRPKDDVLAHYIQPATFGVRVHSEKVNGVKGIRLMHDYPTAIDTGILRGNFPMTAINGVAMGIGDHEFFLTDFDNYDQATFPKIGWVIHDPTETYFSAGTYIKNIQYDSALLTSAANTSLNENHTHAYNDHSLARGCIITLSTGIKVGTTNIAFTFYSETRPYKDSMKYGLECNSSSLINTEGAGNYINQTGHLAKFSSASGTRGYVKITIPFAE